MLWTAAAWLATGSLAWAVSSSSTSFGAKAAPEDMTLGNPKAKVTVIEYASASCPHCARFNNQVFPAFKKKYIDTGKVFYVYREFLTEPVEVAAAGALIARCGGKDRYFAVLDDFFRGQAKAYETGDMRGLILSAGARAGLTEAQVSACLGDQAAAEALRIRVQHYAETEGVEFTPTFKINGQKLPELDHEVVLTDLDAALAPLLKTKRP